MFDQVGLNRPLFTSKRLYAKHKFQRLFLCTRLRFQLVDATHWLNRSAGVSKFNVSLALSLSRLATAFNLF